MKHRNPNCYRCGGEKEPSRENQSFCSKCQAVYMRENRSQKITVDIMKMIEVLNEFPEIPNANYFLELIKKKQENAKDQNSGL